MSVCLVFLLTIAAHEGGRFNPFVANYRPQLFLRTADVTVSLTWPEGTADAEEKMVCLSFILGVLIHRRNRP